MLATSDDRAELERIRESIRELDEAIDRVQGAYLTPAEATERFVASINSRIDFLRTRVSYFAAPGQVPFFESVEQAYAAVQVLRDPEQFRRDALRCFEAMIPSNEAIPRDERPAAVAPLKKKLAKLLADEERELCRLERAGLSVERRRVEPEILLSVWEAL